MSKLLSYCIFCTSYHLGQFKFSPPNVSLASLLAFPAELEHFNAWPGFHSSSINCWVCLFVCICICLFLCSSAITLKCFNYISYTLLLFFVFVFAYLSFNLSVTYLCICLYICVFARSTWTSQSLTWIFHTFHKRSHKLDAPASNIGFHGKLNPFYKSGGSSGWSLLWMSG